MTREQNVRSILESNFAGFKDEIIDVAVKNIMALSAEPCREAENKGEWIPVSERLPEKEKDGYIDFYKCLVAVKCTSRNDICDSFTAYFDGKHFYEHLYDSAFISGVKAWQPLPEPYKAEKRR